MLDRYHSEKTGTNYENQSATVFIIPNHGSEVLNGRDQRVFFFPRSGSVSFIDHAKGKKNPLAPRVRGTETNSKYLSESHITLLMKINQRWRTLNQGDSGLLR